MNNGDTKLDINLIWNPATQKVINIINVSTRSHTSTDIPPTQTPSHPPVDCDWSIGEDEHKADAEKRQGNARCLSRVSVFLVECFVTLCLRVNDPRYDSDARYYHYG